MIKTNTHVNQVQADKLTKTALWYNYMGTRNKEKNMTKTTVTGIMTQHVSPSSPINSRCWKLHLHHRHSYWLEFGLQLVAKVVFKQNPTLQSRPSSDLHQLCLTMLTKVFHLSLLLQCSRKRGQPLKKRKVMFFWILKKTQKNVKNVHSFTGHLITQPLISQLPEVSTGKSRSPTSNSLLRSVDRRKYATENCVW